VVGGCADEGEGEGGTRRGGRGGGGRCGVLELIEGGCEGVKGAASIGGCVFVFCISGCGVGVPEDIFT
jgi:hypothetical protein